MHIDLRELVLRMLQQRCSGYIYAPASTPTSTPIIDPALEL